MDIAHSRSLDYIFFFFSFFHIISVRVVVVVTVRLRRVSIADLPCNILQ